MAIEEKVIEQTPETSVPEVTTPAPPVDDLAKQLQEANERAAKAEALAQEKTHTNSKRNSNRHGFFANATETHDSLGNKRLGLPFQYDQHRFFIAAFFQTCIWRSANVRKSCRS